jgi:hypothetical protein
MEMVKVLCTTVECMRGLELAVRRAKETWGNGAEAQSEHGIQGPDSLLRFSNCT